MQADNYDRELEVAYYEVLACRYVHNHTMTTVSSGRAVLKPCCQIEIAHAMALCHYLIGLPCGALFAFGFHGGLFGLWLGKKFSADPGFNNV